MSSPGGKLGFECYCFCPISPWGGDGNGHFWLGLWTFSYSKLNRSHVVPCSPVLQEGCKKEAPVEARGAKSRSSAQQQILHGERNGSRGVHEGRNVSKQRESGKGTCKGTVQIFGRGRKVGGSSGLYGELQEQNNSRLHLAGEHIGGLLVGGWMIQFAVRM